MGSGKRSGEIIGGIHQHPVTMRWQYTLFGEPPSARSYKRKESAKRAAWREYERREKSDERDQS